MFKKKKIWFNLHLLVSCIFAIPILLLCITGSMLSYASEIQDFFTPKYSNVIVENKEVLSVEELLVKFGEQKPDVYLAGVEISNANGMPVKISADPKDVMWSSWEYIVNPYNGEIVSRNYASYIMLAIKRFHVWFGIHWDSWMPYGNQLTGISTFAFIFILISGIYLYFPNMKRKFINSLKINIKNRGYKLLYNLHCALGAWLSVFLLLMCFSGVYMSYTFIKNIVDPIFGLEKTKGPSHFSVVPELKEGIETTNTDKIKEIGVAFELAKKALNDDYSQMSVSVSGMNDKSKFYGFDYYTKYEVNKTWQNSKTIGINMKRGRVMQGEEPQVYVKKEESKVFNKQKMRKIVHGLHYGNFFGPIGTFIWCISCILFLVFPITGFLMTYRRVKRKKAS